MANAKTEGEKKGHAKGLAEGKEIGRTEALLATARQMKADGMPIDIIAKYTHLAPDEIEKL